MGFSAAVSPCDAEGPVYPDRRMRPSSAVDWDAVTDRYQDLVWSVTRKWGLQGADADEVFQSTWLTAFEKDEVPHDDGMAPWLAAIACWKARGTFRQRTVAALGDDTDVADAGEPEPVRLATALEEEQILRDAIATLDERSRELLDALFLSPDPVPYSVLAPRLGLSVGSIGMMRQRALDKLRAALKRAGFSFPEIPPPEPDAAQGRVRKAS